MVKVDHVLLQSGILVEAQIAGRTFEAGMVGAMIGQTTSRRVPLGTLLALEMLDFGIVDA